MLCILNTLPVSYGGNLRNLPVGNFRSFNVHGKGKYAIKLTLTLTLLLTLTLNSPLTKRKEMNKVP